VPSTSFKANKEKLKNIFATHGVPRRIESDNGPPFNSHEFKEFSKEEGFYHHAITPLHPRANGEVESFMKMVNKTEQISHLQGKDASDRRIAIQEMLQAYRSTPHPATGVSPYNAMYGRDIRTKIDYTRANEVLGEEDVNINNKDAAYKMKHRQYKQSRMRKKTLLVGDYVLVRQPKVNKWTTFNEPTFYVITNMQGTKVTARRVTDHRTICRDVSQFTLANGLINNTDDSYSNNNEETFVKYREIVPETLPTEIDTHNQSEEDVLEPIVPVAAPDDDNSEPIQPIQHAPVRQSNRRREPPKYLEDYECDGRLGDKKTTIMH